MGKDKKEKKDSAGGKEIRKDKKDKKLKKAEKQDRLTHFLGEEDHNAQTPTDTSESLLKPHGLAAGEAPRPTPMFSPQLRPKPGGPLLVGESPNTKDKRLMPPPAFLPSKVQKMEDPATLSDEAPLAPPTEGMDALSLPSNVVENLPPTTPQETEEKEVSEVAEFASKRPRISPATTTPEQPGEADMPLPPTLPGNVQAFHATELLPASLLPPPLLEEIGTPEEAKSAEIACFFEDLPDDGVDEVFWDALGDGSGNNAQSAEPQDTDVSDIPAFVSRATIGMDGSSLLDVPSSLSNEQVASLALKLPQIGCISKATVMTKRDKLRITGDDDARIRAERYAHCFLDQCCDSEAFNTDDISTVAVASDWIASYNGQESSIERDLDVVIGFEKTKPEPEVGAKYRSKTIIEAQPIDASSWHMAVVIATDTSGSVRLRWSSDCSEDSVMVERTRPAPRVFIFGATRARLIAKVQILKKFEAAVKGALAFHCATCQPGKDLGLGSVPLPVKQNTMWKVQQQQSFVQCLLQATGCIAVEFFVQPKCFTGDSEYLEGASALLVGTREQRWLAGNVLAAFAAGMERQKVTELPAHLFGECDIFNVPKEMLHNILGKGMANLLNLMRTTECFIFVLREREPSQTAKGDLPQSLLDHLWNHPTCDLAILGNPRARLGARIKLMAMLEHKYPGFHGKEQLANPSDGLAIDLVCLKKEFKDAKTSAQLEIFAGASGCRAECARNIVFLSGSKQERLRADEYVHWMEGWKLGTIQRVPLVEAREDMMKFEIPREVVESDWLIEQMDSLSKAMKVIVCFDTWEAIDGSRRIIIAGKSSLRRSKLGHDISVQAQSFVKEAIMLDRRARGVSSGDAETDADNDYDIAKMFPDRPQTGQEDQKGKGKGDDKGKGKDSDKGKGKGDNKGKGKDDDKGKGKGETKGKGKGDDKGKVKGDTPGKTKDDDKSKGKGENTAKGDLKGCGKGHVAVKSEDDPSSRDKGEGNKDGDDKGKGDAVSGDADLGLLDIFDDILRPAAAAPFTPAAVAPFTPAAVAPFTPATFAPFTPRGPVAPVVVGEARSSSLAVPLTPKGPAGPIVVERQTPASAPKRSAAPPGFARVADGAPPQVNVARFPAPATLRGSAPPKSAIVRGAAPPKSAIVTGAAPPKSAVVTGAAPPKSAIVAGAAPPKSAIVAGAAPPESAIVAGAAPPESEMVAGTAPPKSAVVAGAAPPKSEMVAAGAPPKSEMVAGERQQSSTSLPNSLAPRTPVVATNAPAVARVHDMSSLALPQTPAVAAAPQTPFLPSGSIAPPMTPAMPASMTQCDVKLGTRLDNIVPMTPAQPRKAKNAPPMSASSSGSKLVSMPPSRIAPQTPAVLQGRARPPLTPSGPGLSRAPQTPAAILSHGRRAVGPQTPAVGVGGGAPRTPATLLGIEETAQPAGEPVTPAAIRRGGMPITPAASRGSSA